MKKDEFFQMLQEPEIRQEILNIVKTGQSAVSNVVVDQDTDVCKAENEHTTRKDDVSMDSSQEMEISVKEERLEKENKSLTEKIRGMSCALGNAKNEIKGLKDEIKKLKQANESLQSQVEQRFSRGWELFEAYQSTSDHTKQILHNGVFTQETNFMSFICGGAQTSSLEKLWDALKECVMYDQQKDAQILSDIFEYCIELVNSSKTQAKYEVLPVKEGERFDSDIHTEGPNSLAQGKVVHVYLPGYQNTYNGKIIKKSIVQVG